MEKISYEYDAIQITQTTDSKPLLLFGAKAVDIEKWAGIPQKKTLDASSAETTGFQRTESPKRLKQLSNFYKNTDNVIQNNLICSLRKLEGCEVTFVPTQDGSVSGKIHISFPNFYTASWQELFQYLRASLELRIGVYKVDKSSQKYMELKSKIGLATDSSDKDGQDEYDTEEESDINDSDDLDIIVSEESHLSDFLEDVAIRHELLGESGEPESGTEKFLGFDRGSLLSFLLPVTLVDGQHRLKGAVLAANELANEQQDEGITMMQGGMTAEEVKDTLTYKYSRELPVSLLLEDEPKEQVFQFVVINQKATPIGKSLLGTIISTTLTIDEMDSVSQRLAASGIELDDARAITWAARNDSSPFNGLVERGTESAMKDLLQWNVMGSLIQIFRELKGGRLFHSRNDYAKRWKDKFLPDSNLVTANNAAEAYEEWSRLDGPWRSVFVEFWKNVKRELAQDSNESRPNFWGNTRKSNIFNKVSLTILAADFFKYLVTSKSTIDSTSDVSELVDSWLEDVNRDYFDQDWSLSGIKKDSPGIRSRWAENWAEYRESPDALPQAKSYRNPKK